MRLLFSSLVLIVLCACQTAISQDKEKAKLGGASQPKPSMSFRSGKQYKRIHQTALRFILLGKFDETEEFLEQYLADNPNDAETLYMLGILHGQKGSIEIAENNLKRAIAAGLPEERLIAGPRKVVEPLAETQLILSLKKKYRQRIVHGPLVGNTTDRTASFWVRTSEESTVQVVVRNEKGEQICQSAETRSKKADDYTAIAKVQGLQPNTRYEYLLLVNGKACEGTGSKTFKTMPAKGEAAKFTIGFGGGAGYVPPNERMWSTIEQQNPQAILLLGDNVYIDDPESLIMQQYTYQRRQSRPEWRQLTSRVPVFTIWDDHDFSTNDSWGGPDIAVPAWKKQLVFPVFRQNWANPGYAGGDDQPGCWYAFQIADVDFIMLDCRYYRSNPRKNPTSMLGSVQLKWLKQQLKSSQGTFKVLCSSVPWDFRTKGGSLDTWNGYQEERKEIFDFIEQNQIDGIVLMSADRHRSDAWKIGRPNTYDFYEFNSSRLTNQHVHPTMEKKGAIFSYNKKQSFGLVTFDTTATDPSATYEVVNIDGKKMHSITVNRSDLK